mmetsp:Transcript_15610/g.34654  ORF Transcript_15610/g.34654 Transcript_15610/m.34654 type:complete len:206 (-) Transcript_15610:38-655(-)
MSSPTDTTLGNSKLVLSIVSTTTGAIACFVPGSTLTCLIRRSASLYSRSQTRTISSSITSAVMPTLSNKPSTLNFSPCFSAILENSFSLVRSSSNATLSSLFSLSLYRSLRDMASWSSVNFTFLSCTFFAESNSTCHSRARWEAAAPVMPKLARTCSATLMFAAAFSPPPAESCAKIFDTCAAAGPICSGDRIWSELAAAKHCPQ